MKSKFSFLELNAAIIVSSAPAFASFARTHVLETSAIRSLLSSLTSFSSKARSSESNLSSDSKAGKIAHEDDGDNKFHRDHPYYELNETCGLQSGVSADQNGTTWVPTSPGLPRQGGIVRTMAFEQTVKPSQV